MTVNPSQPKPRKNTMYKINDMNTADGYTAVPWYGKKYIILYNGQQIAEVPTAAKAVAYIRNQQKITKAKCPPNQSNTP